MKNMNKNNINWFTWIGFLTVAVAVTGFCVEVSNRFQPEVAEVVVPERKVVEVEEENEEFKGTLELHQNRTDLVWYEIPEYNLRFQVTDQEKQYYDSIIKKEKEAGEKLVWYEVPELGIKFLVTPWTKEDLWYEPFNYSDRLRLEKPVELISVSFYRHSISAFIEEKRDEIDRYDRWLTSCEETPSKCWLVTDLANVFFVARLSLEDLSVYEPRPGLTRPFCPLAGGYVNTGSYVYCREVGKDGFFADLEASEYFKENQSNIDGILFKSAVPL